MKIKSFISSILLMTSYITCFAANATQSSLMSDREQVIKEYVSNLQNADLNHMIQLFDKDGFVVSTSRGKINAVDFFNAFLPNIDSASTELKGIFVNALDQDHLAARFHFHFKMKDGEVGDGEYMDDFAFVNNQATLSSVYMFENLK